MDAKGNVNDPYTAHVDAMRKSFQATDHRVGGGTALDFDPSTRPGWTGAKNAYEGFHHGITGGAYGRTGNIMTQISGRVGGGTSTRRPPPRTRRAPPA